VRFAEESGPMKISLTLFRKKTMNMVYNGFLHEFDIYGTPQSSTRVGEKLGTPEDRFSNSLFLNVSLFHLRSYDVWRSV